MARRKVVVTEGPSGTDRPDATPADLATYELRCETGYYALTGMASQFDPPDRARLMLDRTRAALKARPAATETDKADVEAALREVDGFLAVIREHRNEAMCDAAVRAIDAALLLGLNHGGGPDFAREQQRRALKDHVTPANEARRNKKLWASIEPRAAAHWELVPAHRGRPDPTARAIVDLVASDMQASSLRDDALTKFQEKIRGMLRRHMRRTIDIHP